jgi:molecular chaperone DnaK (HSP70)
VPARFLIGIDLGTTNSAVAYVDTAAADPRVRVFEVPQLVAPGEVAPRRQLPSFVYLAGEVDLAPHETALPWRPVAKVDRDPQAAASTATRAVVGELARSQGARMASRMIASAKSWLCHPGVDRNAPILPWGEGDGPKLSPVAAEAQILAHVRDAWDHAHPDAPLAAQEVLVTVPASFDEAARELTLAAAAKAGLPPVVLLEEPQAAFYAYLAARGDAWRKDLEPGDVVLVCDIGGGTTDFSLIEVAEQDGSLALERIAVGDHILLGGDNMDLALAATVQRELNKTLDPMQQRALVHAARRAKEQLLAAGAPEKAPVAILSRGSKLIGGTLKAEVTREQAHAMLVDGFFPTVPADAKAARRKAAGLREMGLPYAHDPAITRHLAEFLGRFGRMPTAVLFNGGVMKSDALRARIVELLRTWAGADVAVLAGADLDLAVALGAAHYGQVRHGKGVRIRGGTARAYYIGIESAMPAIPGFPPPVKALCVAPQGLEEGSTVELPDDELGLVVGELSTFRFYAAANRKEDPAGTLLDADSEGLVELDPVEKLVEADGERAPGELVPVKLESHVTELGTLELWCAARDGQGRWKLEYSVRERE